MPAKIEIPDAENLARRYLAGESLYKLSREIGIARGPLRDCFKSKGMQIRNCSNAMIIRMNRIGFDGRRKLTRAANIAARGRNVPISEKIKMARTNELRGNGISFIERQLADNLLANGYIVNHQTAVGPYNIDLTFNITPVAVEIFGGYFHMFGRAAARMKKRTKYILDQGWSLIICWVNGKTYPLTIGGTNEIINFAKMTRLNPTSKSQYRVILGNGDTAPIDECYFNTPTFIKSLRA